jgi:hypothetical protein
MDMSTLQVYIESIHEEGGETVTQGQIALCAKMKSGSSGEFTEIMRSIGFIRGWREFIYSDPATDVAAKEYVKRFASMVHMMGSDTGCDTFPIFFICYPDGATTTVDETARRFGNHAAYDRPIREGCMLTGGGRYSPTVGAVPRVPDSEDAERSEAGAGAGGGAGGGAGAGAGAKSSPVHAQSSIAAMQEQGAGRQCGGKLSQEERENALSSLFASIEAVSQANLEAALKRMATEGGEDGEADGEEVRTWLADYFDEDTLEGRAHREEALERLILETRADEQTVKRMEGMGGVGQMGETVGRSNETNNDGERNSNSSSSSSNSSSSNSSSNSSSSSSNSSSSSSSSSSGGGGGGSGTGRVVGEMDSE